MKTVSAGMPSAPTAVKTKNARISQNTTRPMPGTASHRP